MSTLSYTQFLWNSQNDHGIHSPFMYRFVSKCFYTKGPRLTKRVHRAEKMELSYPAAEILYRIFNYLKPAKTFVLGYEDEPIIKMLRYAGEENKIKTWFFSPLAPIPGGTDLAVIADTEKEAAMASLELILANAHNDTVCVIPNIHSTRLMERTWHAIQAHPKVSATVDAYHLGLIFFRREQVEQHFMVRPSKGFFTEAILGIRNLYGLLG
jgi:hypothetical protein